MNTFRRALAALALTVLSGCAATPPLTGSHGGHVDPPARETPTASTSPKTTPAATSSTPSTTASTAAPTGPPASRRTAVPPAGANRQDWAPLRVAVSATCVERGDELIVSATSLPEANLTFAVGYRRPRPGEPKFVPDFAMFRHEQNPTGTIHWSFVVRPTTPFGPGIVKVVTATRDGRGAFAEIDIEVAPAC